MENLSSGTFFVPGGHEFYRKAKEMFEKDSCQVPRKGVKLRNKGSIGSLQNRIQGDFLKI